MSTGQKNKPTLFSRLLNTAFVLVVILAWFFQDQFNLKTEVLLLFTGAALLIIIATFANKKKFKNLQISDKHLERNRKIIGNIDYKDY